LYTTLKTLNWSKAYLLKLLNTKLRNVKSQKRNTEWSSELATTFIKSPYLKVLSLLRSGPKRRKFQWRKMSLELKRTLTLLTRLLKSQSLMSTWNQKMPQSKNLKSKRGKKRPPHPLSTKLKLTLYPLLSESNSRNWRLLCLPRTWES